MQVTLSLKIQVFWDVTPDMVQYHGRIESTATMQQEPQITHLNNYFLNVNAQYASLNYQRHVLSHQDIDWNSAHQC